MHVMVAPTMAPIAYAGACLQKGEVEPLGVDVKPLAYEQLIKTYWFDDNFDLQSLAVNG